MNMNITWTDEMIELLKEKIKEGVSSSVIAENLTRKFRIKFSRNSVIGKAHRLKLKIERVVAEKKVKPVKAPKAEKKIVAVSKPVVEDVVEHPVATGPFLNPYAKPTVLLDLTDNQCRYSVGDVRTKDLIFCGAVADSNMHKSYCRYCYPIVYIPVRRTVAKGPRV